MVQFLEGAKQILTGINQSIFGLLGVLEGAFIERRTQRQNWLFQKRAEVFERFLLALEKFREETARYLRSSSEKEPFVIEQAAIDFYEPVFVQARVARLFVKRKSRENIEQLIREIRALQVSTNLGDERHRAIIKKAEELQNILEGNLEVPDW